MLDWKLPDYYLVVDYYKVNKAYLLFSRLVDVKSGVIIWHHFETVIQDEDTTETFATLLAPTTKAVAAAVGANKSIVLAEATENGKASEALKDATLPYLLKEKNFATLLRNPPIAKPVRSQRKLPSGEVEVLEKTYYKLYDKQFSVIARSAQQLWPEADDNVSLAFADQTRPMDSSLIATGRYSDEQLDLFWQRPRKSISAMFVETRTGRIRSKITVVSRDDVSWSTLAQKLAEALAR